MPYASKETVLWRGEKTPVAHSCGHDIHMVSWVATADALAAALKDRWHGTLMFVAQPAEETDSGAAAMLSDGLFERFGKPDHALALHTGPFGYGMVGYRSGAIMSAEDTLEITFNGRGGHGSSPHSAIDPVLIAAAVRRRRSIARQPRKGSGRIRRVDDRRDSRRHGRQHHSR